MLKQSVRQAWTASRCRQSTRRFWQGRGGKFWISIWLTAVLAVSAAAMLGYRFTLLVGREDTDAVESVPLCLLQGN